MNEDVVFKGRFDDGEILSALGEVSTGVEKTQSKFEKMAEESAKAFKEAAQSLRTDNAILQSSLRSTQQEVNKLTRSYNALSDKTTAQAKQQRAQIDSLVVKSKEYSAQIAKNNADIIEYGKAAENAFKKSGDAMQLNTNQAQQLTFQLNDVFAQVGAGTSVLQTLIQQGPQITQVFGGVGNTFKFLGRQVLSAVKSIFTLQGGFKALGGALVALTGIAVASYYRKSQEEGERLERATAALGGQFEVVTGRVFEFGESIVKVFTGEAIKGEVLKNLTRIFSGYGDELTRAADAARKFTEVQQTLDRAANDFIISEGQALRVVDQLRSSVDNETLSYGKRIQALQEAGRVEKQLEVERIRAATLRSAALKARIEQESAAGGISVENGKLIAESERRVIDLMREAANRERADQNQLRSLRQQRADDLDKERKKVEALNEAYQKLLDRLADRTEKARISELLGTDKLQAEKEAALREVDNFVNEIAAAATAAGRSLPSGFASDIQDLVSAVETEFRRGVDKVREKDGDVFTPLLLPKDKGNGLEKEAQSAFNRLEFVFRKNEPLLQRIKDGIATAFGLSKEELNEGLSALSDAFTITSQAFLQGIDANTEAKIVQQDRIIDAIRTRIDETSQLLQVEEQREKDGFANSAQAYRDKLAAENTALAQANEKRLQLEEKAAKRTLVLNSLQQVSEATLTIVRLLSSSAKLGIVGFIAAAAVGVTTVFSIIAQAKAQAAKFAQVPGFKDGTSFVTGAGNSRSDSVPANLSVGERVMDAASNAQIGGAAVSNPELVRLALKGRELETAAASAGEERRRAIDAWNMQRDTEYRGVTEAQMTKVVNGVIDYLKTRPVEKYGPQGKYLEYKEGGAIIRQLIPPDNPRKS